MKSLYLLINIFTVLVPFLFSFHKKLKFNTRFKHFAKASLLVAIPFVLWDATFTRMGIWGFNPDYLLGVYILGIPIEEILFFFCIPFSCIFTYHCLTLFFNFQWNEKTEKMVVLFLIAFLLSFGVMYSNQLYTSITFFSLAFFLIFFKFYLKVTWLSTLMSVYLILLIPFSIVNGILTGSGLSSPVVWYNEAHFMGFRLVTIPFEDIFYGFELILLNLFFYLHFVEQEKKKSTRLV